MSAMPSADRSKPMEVKYWSRAGLMLTDWCNAACACCYANCSTRGKARLGVEDALSVWQGLIQASPHGCRVHLTGGEPFGDFELLLEVCRQAKQRGLGPLESVETNGYWAQGDEIIRQRLEALNQQGLGRLDISADPYHQQFVPIARPRRLAALAREILGADRVRVRWEDWLASGCDVAALAPADRTALFEGYAAKGRDRLTGRGATGLDEHLPKHPPHAFDNDPCAERLLRGRHVHISPEGHVWPATCVGIAIGNALKEPCTQIWARLKDSWPQMPLVAALCGRGPMGLMDAALQGGFCPRAEGYATKCQLCFELRRHLFVSAVGPWQEPLAPESVYGRCTKQT
jgi:hypothetical protein